MGSHYCTDTSKIQTKATQLYCVSDFANTSSKDLKEQLKNLQIQLLLF